MKRFFIVVFGGLAAVFGGLILVWLATLAWRAFPTQSIVSALQSLRGSADGTSTLGMSQTIHYTANEEEDLVNAALENVHDTTGRITASAYIVKDLTTGEVWTEYDSDRSLPIASLAKLVTAVISRRLVPGTAMVPITSTVMATFGNTAGFHAGEHFTAAELLYPLLMVSSNDAAEALARANPAGNRAAFIKAMNDFAQSIGAYHTYFADPSGLSPMDVSSAGDVALILDWIRQHDPAILDITALKAKTVRGHTWVNPTHFLSWSYYIGGKNGFTDEAKRTGASLFELGYSKDIYAVVVLGSDNRDDDVIRLINKVR